jgi:hypothetical protein
VSFVAALSLVLGCEGLGLAAATGDLMSDRLAGAVIAQVRLLRATTRVIESHTLDSALTILNLAATVVTHHHCFSRHDILLRSRNYADHDSTAYNGIARKSVDEHPLATRDSGLLAAERS